jgi:hypothetical protein
MLVVPLGERLPLPYNYGTVGGGGAAVTVTHCSLWHA